jgi:hypothetical protein
VGTTVTVTIVTSTAATKVWLSSALRGSFAESVSGYTDNGTKRTWKVTYVADANGYQNLTAHASDVNGNTVNRAFSLDIISQGRSVIYDAYASPIEVDANSSAELIVITSTNVTSLAYNIISGNGSVSVPFQTSGYTDNAARGERVWRGNYYYPGAQSGVSRITVTVATIIGTTASTTVSVNVKGVVSTDLAIHFLSALAPGAITGGTIYNPGEPLNVYVTTGLGVQKITAAYNGQTIETTGGTINGSYKYWSVSTTVAQSSMNVSVTTYSASGAKGVSEDLPIVIGVFEAFGDTDSEQ